MEEEAVDIFDCDDRPTGNVVPKKQAHEQGLWHRSAHVWIYNDRGNILMQKRAATKDTFPGLWDISVAGHISTGESPLIGALREIREEIGTEARPEELEYLTTIHMEYPYPQRGCINREHCYVYLMKRNLDPNKLTLQKEEVEAVRFFPPGEFSELIKADRGIIVPLDNYYETILEAIVKKTL